MTKEATTSRLLHNHVGMSAVQGEYNASGLSDTEFAARLTKELGRSYSTAQVRTYRIALGIGNNKSGDVVRIRQLEAKLAHAVQVASRVSSTLRATADPHPHDTHIAANTLAALVEEMKP